MPRYNPAEIEPRWQAYWDRHELFKTPELPRGDKRYVLDMFPYPSGHGLHVGHPEGYTATDIVARFQRMNGVDVLHPMGFDAFGLPAEEHAIKTGEHPRIQTQANIDNFTRQLKMLGFSYDWSRVLSTTDEEYFRWTQWIFLVIYDTWFDRETGRGRPIAELPIPDDISAAGESTVAAYRDDHRLAYLDDALVNWCEGLGTVLANEEVIDGKSERGGHPVRRIPLRQWMMRITDYADRLLEGLDDLDWPDGIKKLQSDWIGRSTGAEVDFYVGDDSAYESWSGRRAADGFPDDPGPDALRVYTTRPDTLFGATYIVVSPEHPMVGSWLADAPEDDPRRKYVDAAAFKSDRERTGADADKQKTGVFSGRHAINPAGGGRIPIWIGDYVLAGYGTGAIMAVPAHDQRDFEFARKFELPVVPVVDPPADHADRGSILAGEACFPARGTAINSGRYDGKATDEVKTELTAELNERGVGRGAVNYKLRDWLFSRQRFWGEPFPIAHEVDDDDKPTGIRRPIPVDDLPVTLPDLKDFKPSGSPEGPLAKADDDWLYVTIDGRRHRRETNTMPQWAGSCWYYLRYIDPHNDAALVDAKKERAWMPVDLYVGGAEHAVLHLLYSRFWHKVLYDRGHVSTPEPFGRLVNQGMILGEPGPDGKAVKMSKARGNVVNPDDIVENYGADSLRLYEMFMGPLEATKPWSMKGVAGVRNFLDRVWRLVVDQDSDDDRLAAAIADGEPDENPDEETRRLLHKTIKAVTEDTRSMSFNTAISRMMEFTNHYTGAERRDRATLLKFLKLLSPYAPHLADELAMRLGHDGSLATEPWPAFDESALHESTIELPVQINGKVKSKIRVSADADQETVLTAATGDDRIAGLIEGKTLVKKIVVPGRLVNLVAK